MLLTILVLVVCSGLGSDSVQVHCPPDSIIRPCTCVPDDETTLTINCDASLVHSNLTQVQAALTRFENYEATLKIAITGINSPINSSVINVPNHFLPGGNSYELRFHCKYPHKAESPVLRFANNSLVVPGLGCSVEHFTVDECNLLVFRAEILTSCLRLKSVIIRDSNVDGVSGFPKLDDLQLLSVTTRAQWPGGSGLRHIDLSADRVPNLAYWAFNGSQLSDKDLEFASGLNHSDFVRLGANRLHDLPDASNWQVLRDCDISVDEFAGTGLSIQLPKNRSSPYLSFVIRSQIGKLFRVSKLRGSFSPDTFVSLYLKLDKLDEAIFSPALKQGLEIFLNSDNRFDCGCNLAWLIRDPESLGQVHHGSCSDGRRFEDLTADQFDCCPDC